MLRPEEAPRPFTVTELANEIKRELRPLTAVLVKGEVTGVKRSAAGIFNFTIQDGFSKLEAVLFADRARLVTTLPEGGQVFVFRGRGGFYNKNGRLSFHGGQIEFDDGGKVRARLGGPKRLPVVTALGHTSDRTVADMVADAECRTPTEAGSRVVPRKADLLARLSELGRRLSREQARRVAREFERLQTRRERLAWLSPVQQLGRQLKGIEERRQRVD